MLPPDISHIQIHVVRWWVTYLCGLLAFLLEMVALTVMDGMMFRVFWMLMFWMFMFRVFMFWMVVARFRVRVFWVGMGVRMIWVRMRMRECGGMAGHIEQEMRGYCFAAEGLLLVLGGHLHSFIVLKTQCQMWRSVEI